MSTKAEFKPVPCLRDSDGPCDSVCGPCRDEQLIEWLTKRVETAETKIERLKGEFKIIERHAIRGTQSNRRLYGYIARALGALCSLRDAAYTNEQITAEDLQHVIEILYGS